MQLCKYEYIHCVICDNIICAHDVSLPSSFYGLNSLYDPLLQSAFFALSGYLTVYESTLEYGSKNIQYLIKKIQSIKDIIRMPTLKNIIEMCIIMSSMGDRLVIVL